jgi:D-3-phosphoglycerate dehydrogenase
MTRPRVLITEPEGYSERALTRLRQKFELDLGPVTRQQLMDRAGNYVGMIIRLAHCFDEELLLRCSRLRFLASPTTGLNHIDVEVAERIGVAVLSLRGEREFLDTIHATAEHTWALLMALLRNIPAAHASVLSGEWDRDRFKTHELHGKTLGVVGFGRLGTKVARYAQTFGMRVVAHDPHVTPPQGIASLSLDDLFATADVIVVLAAYSQKTHGLIGQSLLKFCRPGTLLVNTSRGEILDEQALLHALRNRKLAGAALDVLCDEHLSLIQRPRSAELIEYAKQHGNLLLTPHVGGATHESMRRTEEFVAEKVVGYIND